MKKPIKTVYQLMAEVERLEREKNTLVEQIVVHSTPRRLISEEVRNQTVLALVDELRDIQNQIDELKGMTF